ncbi:hypothetical protein [Chitinimonas naiadis]
MSLAAPAKPAGVPKGAGPQEAAQPALTWRHWQIVLAWCFTGILLLAWPLAQGWLWFDPGRFTPLPRYMLDPRDSSPHALYKARSAERQDARILMLGSSAARESLLPPLALSDLLDHVTVLDMTSSGQNPLESLFLLAQAPIRPGQRVLVFIGPSQLGQADFAARLNDGDFLVDPLPFADALSDDMVKPPTWQHATSRAWLRIDGSRKLATRLLRVALPAHLQQVLYGAPPIKPLRYYYDGVSPGDAKRQSLQAQQISQQMQQHAGDNLARLPHLLRLLAEHCRQAGARLNVLETPHARGDVNVLYGPWWPRYLEIQRQSALTQGYRYIDLNGQVALSANDFTDKLHLAPAARERWSKALATWLRQQIAAEQPA